VALAGSGADADEVSDDLRRHVEEEVRAANLRIVTEDDVRRILAPVGEPEAAGPPRPAASAPAPPPVLSASARKPPGALNLILGFILPLMTLGFELVSGASAGVLFDPLPTWWHVLLVALVPAANLWIWRAARARDTRHATAIGWLSGAAIGISLFYTILYVPFTPWAVVAILFFGLGLIPLAPLFATATAFYLRAAYQKHVPGVRLPGGWPGALAGIGLLTLFQLPNAITYYGLAKITSEDPDVRAHGVRVLRRFGDEDLILRACYGLLRNRNIDMDVIRWLASGNQYVSAEQAREAYYRVTGRPFNSVPAPSLFTQNGRWTALEDEFTWDEGLGGDAVAQRVKGLSLLSSRMDAAADPEAATVYCEWTMEFKNVSNQPREARAQVALPPGGVVSRVTLWINGEEREAAFGGRSQVREAYEEVAVVQRRDPILVTTCGPDRVLVQCFPVLVGGVMKARLGISAPLLLESPEQGRFVWPQFLERNFSVAGDLKHELWIESSAALSNGLGANAATQAASGKFSLRGTVTELDLVDAVPNVIVRRPAITEAWTPARVPGQVIRQTIRSRTAQSPSKLILVLDGSAQMRDALPEIAAGLAAAPRHIPAELIVASDRRTESIMLSNASSDELLRRLRRFRFEGGQDNVPALETALDAAAETSGAVVLWIHNPQATLLSAETGLRQRLEHNVAGTRLIELQTRTGPDRLVEKLDGLSAVEHAPRLGTLREDLARLFARWTSAAQQFELVRERVNAEPAPAGPQAGRDLERLWARDEALRLAAARNPASAVALATEQQLVTPLTGAVVLETAEQYAQHGLTPADPATVPAVPEPNAMALAALAAGLWWWRRMLRQRKAS